MAAVGFDALYPQLSKDTRRIRTLTILPSADQSAIVECTLAERDLDDEETEYDALSYCWGDPEVTTPIIVNGRKMEVTTNLEDALRQLRCNSIPNPMILWADAVCINQDDKEERGHQVKFMGDIYSKASTVHAWLGHGGHLEKRGLAAFERLSRSECSDPNNSIRTSHATSYCASDGDLFDLAFVSQVCGAVYWERVWIIQELALAKKVVLHQGTHQGAIACWMCLRRRVDSCWVHGMRVRARPRPKPSSWDLEDISRAILPCPSSGKGYWQISAAIDLILQAKGLMQRVSSRNMMQFTIDAMHKKTTNGRDHIYSLLFLLQAYVDIEADYTKPVGEVFEDAVAKFVQNTKSVRILAYASSGSWDLASWVPDFRVLRANLRPDALTGFLLGSQWCPLPREVLQESHHSVRPRQRVLQVMGAHFDRVRMVQFLRHSDREQWIKGYLKRCAQFGNDEHDVDPRKDPLAEQNRPRLEEFAGARFLFKTSRGYFGMAYHRPCIGDHVCTLGTRSEPEMFCLRYADSNIQLAYSLVGACAIWQDENPDTSISPLEAVAKMTSERGCPADRLFTPVLLV